MTPAEKKILAAAAMRAGISALGLGAIESKNNEFMTRSFKLMGVLEAEAKVLDPNPDPRETEEVLNKFFKEDK